MRARPAVTEERLFSGDRCGNLFALDLADGTSVWPNPVTLKGQLLATPVLVGDFVVVAPFQGDNLLEVYRQNGEFYWPFKPGN